MRGKTIEAIEAEKEIKAGCPFCLIDLVDQDFKKYIVNKPGIIVLRPKDPQEKS